MKRQTYTTPTGLSGITNEPSASTSSTMKAKRKTRVKEVIITIFVGFYNKDGKERTAARQAKTIPIYDDETLSSLQNTVITRFKETYVLMKKDIRKIK